MASRYDFQEGAAGPASKVVKTKLFSTLELPAVAVAVAAPAKAAEKPKKEEKKPATAAPKKEAAPAVGKPAPPAPVAAAPAGGDAQLLAEIAAQGEVVKAAKEPPTDKAVIQAEVQKLLALKAKLPATAPATAAAPAAAAAAAAPAGEDAQLLAEIAAQGELVKTLKAAKEPPTDKAVIQAEVQKLLALKAKLPASAAPAAAAPATKAPATNTRKQDKQDRFEENYEEQEKDKLVQLKAQRTTEFGMIDMVQSQTKTDRKWTVVGELDVAFEGDVLIRGYAHAIRGNKHMTFVIVRQRMHTVQCILQAGEPGTPAADFKAFVDKIPVESVIDVTGRLVSADVKSCTMSSIELQVKTLFVVQPARVRLPFQPREAERPPPTAEEEEEATKKGSGKATKLIGQEMRLDHRSLDLRTPAMQAIARISDSVIRYFTDYLRSQQFVEVMTPKLLGGSSEGGADVFKTDYFGQPACLAQSPQLHKQMLAACSGFERVFEIGPVFRAENSLTARHMTEFHGLDLEMSIYEHYHEALKLFSNLFFYIFDQLTLHNQHELQVIRAFSPFEDLKYRIEGREDALLLSFDEGIELLEQDHLAGNPGCVSREDVDKLKSYSVDSDPSTPVEKRLGWLVKQKYGVDFYMLDKYPLAVRPFYTMPDPQDERKSNSYDFFIRGQEILSGAQRVHDAAMLEQKVQAKGVPVKSLKFYIDSFKDGALPHAGGGIGLERVVMLFLGLPNIRWAALFTRDPKRLIP